MERDELKSMWIKVHQKDQGNNKKSLNEILQMKHSKAVEKMLTDQRKKAIVYLFSFSLFLSLMVYAFLYLRVDLSIGSFIPLVLAGLFLFYKTTSEISGYRILSSTEDKTSIKDSILFFRKQINRIEKLNFVFNIFLFYTISIGVSIVVINDKGAIALLSETGMIPFLIIFILILLSVPWIIKYLYRQRYKEMYCFFKDNLNSVEHELIK